MAENDFVVNFGTDDFQVIFGEQGPQGPASVAVPFDIADTYEIGNIVYDASANLFSSKTDDNTGNVLTDTDFWVALGIASGVVTQLDDLTDVTVDTPTDGQTLLYNGSQWVNSDAGDGITASGSLERVGDDIRVASFGIGQNQMGANAVGVNVIQDGAVTTSKIRDGDVSGEKFNTVAAPVSGQVLSSTGPNRQMEWVNPGTTPVNPTQEKTTLTLDPTEIVLGTGTTPATATVSINDGFSIDGVAFEVRDQNNHIVPVGENSNVAAFTVDNTLRGHVSVSVTVAYTQDSDSTTGSDTVNKSIRIEESYFSLASATQPTAVGNMVDQGVWNSPKELTQTTNNTLRNYYIALPTDQAPYEFTSGIAIFNATNLGVISTNYTLFQLTDFDDDPAGRTFIVDIAEA